MDDDVDDDMGDDSIALALNEYFPRIFIHDGRGRLTMWSLD